jgi:hypothetical protein
MNAGRLVSANRPAGAAHRAGQRKPSDGNGFPGGEEAGDEAVGGPVLEEEAVHHVGLGEAVAAFAAFLCARDGALFLHLAQVVVDGAVRGSGACDEFGVVQFLVAQEEECDVEGERVPEERERGLRVSTEGLVRAEVALGLGPEAPVAVVVLAACDEAVFFEEEEMVLRVVCFEVEAARDLRQVQSRVRSDVLVLLGEEDDVEGKPCVA